jgi:peptidoglycan/xylan/chitin deacetylase (PgdA/CDA1 family)
MKHLTHFMLLFLFIFSLFALTGCSNQTQASTKNPPAEEATPEPAKKQPTSILAADDFSNLQLTDPTLPVYDKYTLAERQADKLPQTLPQLIPYTTTKVVYLTFDDGPDNKNTPAILDILKQAKIKATFFVIGKNVKLYPKMVQRIYDENHAIGNHSYDHNYTTLYASPAAYIAEMKKTDDAIKAIIGVRPLITRAPGGVTGHFTKAFTTALAANAYVEYGWNISTADAAPNHPVAQDFIDNVLAQIDNPAVSAHPTLLMHCSSNHEETVKALPTIIQILKDHGYTFGVITPMTPSPW